MQPVLQIIGTILATVVLLSSARGAGETVFRSESGRTQLLELYTSEGCSSCPLAEAWLSTLRADKRLWREVVPVAFHVDYWDKFGWKDRFASRGYTDRQRAYAALWNAGTIYTPGFVLNGREWSDWRGGAASFAPAKGDAASGGILTATLHDSRKVVVTYRPASPADTGSGRQIFVSLLACGIKSSVRAGENSGRELTHDFVALSCDKQPLSGNGQETIFHLPEPPKDAGRLALAVWVSLPDGLGAAQAAGGWLDGSARP